MRLLTLGVVTKRCVHFCQAQPKLQVQLEAKLALISIPPLTRASCEIAWNQQNLLCNICMSNLVESATILKRWMTASMEENINISSASEVKPN